jgi:uncharacterized tellurite resistance protein B-like protein
MFRRFLRGAERSAEPTSDDGGPTNVPGSDHGGEPASGVAGSGESAETDTVRRIVARLESMPHERARLLASMAYVLARAAYADLDISDAETTQIERILVGDAGLDAAQAVLVTEMAKIQARTYGQTEDYLVTREFRAMATDEQCLDLLRCCYLVSAADGSITADESGTLSSIANELGIDESQVHALRSEFAESFSAIQGMRKAQGPGQSAG